MIMGAIDVAGGPMRLNTVVMKHMRTWVLKMAKWTINKATNPTGGIFPGSMAAALNVATLFHSRNDYNSALQLYQQTSDAASLIVVPGVWDNPARWQLLARDRMGLLHLMKGETMEARKCLEEVRKTKVAMVGPDHPDVLQTESRLAMVFDSDQEWVEARKLYEHVIKGYRSLGPTFEQNLLGTMMNFGVLLIKVKDFEAARKNYKDVVSSMQRTNGANHVDALHASTKYGIALSRLGQWTPARRALEPAIEGLIAQLGPAHNYVLDSRAELAIVLGECGDMAKATALFRTNLHLWKQDLRG